eukprot:CAMPEP_0177606402 /NCGR_PEP_ID=MMETSP0419_2-20121207/17287_1 /TAXON_ID=582737 /ORGANISM="Tetraselmis sp., Strain GSL018" /LENGTH=175 /DNA_ID=CAMNT_0019100759 /DNA_START=57 /DNA_END=584 /DNA_ORIENTATION=+
MKLISSFMLVCAFLVFCEGRRYGRNWDDDDPLMDAEEQEVIRQLVRHRDLINRNYNLTSAGIEAYTWSDDEEIADLLKTHVQAMKQRVEARSPVRRRDPLFRALFDNASDLRVEVEDSRKGVRVAESATSECGVALVQTHAQVVSAFIKYGSQEIRANHDIPQACSVQDTVDDAT